MNSLTASRSHIKAYQRCNQPTSKVSIVRKYSKKFFKEIIKVKTSTWKKSEFQMGFEPTDGIWTQMGFETTTLRDLVVFSPWKNLFEYFHIILTLDIWIIDHCLWHLYRYTLLGRLFNINGFFFARNAVYSGRSFTKNNNHFIECLVSTWRSVFTIEYCTIPSAWKGGEKCPYRANFSSCHASPRL